ncbi:mitochondrial carrier protein [Stemphylium lycopersici]|uniref:Mitochondrial carrier protein n=1 Tax=Stemphylium lycopersici TaxID=183478 RepID=A0A364N2Y3_STELY|nr:mitochondrial carrier protein [Stemphylium lycopersici]RAR10579.1 mitochondrial carrier protein [Stemphylium lycopersici]
MPLERDTSGRTYILHPNGQRTHYILSDFTDPWKPGETILIQHGFGRHAAFWYHWIPVLSRNYRVVRRDLRGHGYSSYPSRNSLSSKRAKGDGEKESEEGEYEYNVDTIIGEMVDTLDQLGLKKVHFLGESTGGMLGEILAARHPERLLSLTVCSTPTYLPPPALQLFAFDKKDWPSACRELGSRGWAEALSRIPGTIPVSDANYLPWYLDQIGVSDGEGLAQYAGFLSTLDARPWLDKITVPTLILSPTQSAAVKVEDMEALQKTIQKSMLVLIDGPGHEIYVTQAEKCQEAFLRFLEDLKARQDTAGQS